MQTCAFVNDKSDDAHCPLMNETLTVTQLNTRARSLLVSSPGLNDVWVLGEISNFKRYGSGHSYFTLKDSGSEIRCAMFRQALSRIDFEPADSMKVTAFGHIDIYVERGSYQFVVETMKRSGVGELYAAYEDLKRRLEAEGLFDPARKRRLPVYPRVIGVVTSETGAVIHDIITTTGRRFPADILLCPAQVQGEGAAESVAAGIAVLNRAGVDVIIVGRGGGSIEDLWAFNEEKVARAIAASAAPVISAVGHETDFTIADLVADFRAPTPTGAAEIALRDRKEVAKQIDSLSLMLDRALMSAVGTMRSRFGMLDSKLSPRRAGDLVRTLSQELGALRGRADAALMRKTDRMGRGFYVLDAKLVPRRARDAVMQHQMKVADLSDSMAQAVSRMSEGRRRDLGFLSERLEALDHRRVLGRGYSYVRDPGGRVLSSVSQLAPGSGVEIVMRDGTARAAVESARRYSDG